MQKFRRNAALALNMPALCVEIKQESQKHQHERFLRGAGWDECHSTGGSPRAHQGKPPENILGNLSWLPLGTCPLYPLDSLFDYPPGSLNKELGDEGGAGDRLNWESQMIFYMRIIGKSGDPIILLE